MDQNAFLRTEKCVWPKINQNIHVKNVAKMITMELKFWICIFIKLLWIKNTKFKNT